MPGTFRIQFFWYTGTVLRARSMSTVPFTQTVLLSFDSIDRNPHAITPKSPTSDTFQAIEINIFM